MSEPSAGSFEEFHRKNHERIYELILKEVVVRDIAEDLTLETFLNAFRAWNRKKPELDVDIWIEQIAIHNCQNCFNRLWRRTGDEPTVE